MNKNSRRKRNYRWMYWSILLTASGILLSILYCTMISIRIQNASFEPERSEENSPSEGLLGVSYNYYLDFSPSMSGFFVEGLNSDMFRLNEVLKELNSYYQSTRFYRCTSAVEPLSDATSFYNSMTQETNLQNVFYEAVSDGTIVEKIRELDLTSIWTDRYTDGDIYHSGKGNVNIIITDMNFRENESDEAGYSARIDDFADVIGEAAKNANIHIYNLHSAFSGSLSDEYYILPDEESVESVDQLSGEKSVEPVSTNEYEGMRPFFLIVVSDDNEAYTSYIRELEHSMGEHQIDFSENFELVNNVAQAVGDREVDLQYYVRNNEVTKTGFNFDNNSFENLGDNEIAFQIIKGRNASEIIMPVLQLQLPGYYYSGDEADSLNGIDNTTIGVVSKVYCPNTKWLLPIGIDYQEDTTSEVITYQNAKMFWQQGQLYLQTSLGMNNTANMSEAQQRLGRWGGRPHFVVYLQFYLETPDYRMPGWIQEISCDSITSEAKILHIETVFTQIMNQKKNVYATRDASERYLGDVVFYITYEEE